MIKRLRRLVLVRYVGRWRIRRQLMREYGTTDLQDIAVIRALRWSARVEHAANTFVDRAGKITAEEWAEAMQGVRAEDGRGKRK